MGQDNRNKFLVRVTRVKNEFAVVEVEATDKEQADAIAMYKCINDDVVWQSGTTDLKTFDIQRLPK